MQLTVENDPSPITLPKMKSSGRFLAATAIVEDDALRAGSLFCPVLLFTALSNPCDGVTGTELR